MASLIPAIRSSLLARMERLLANPLIARIDLGPGDESEPSGSATPADAVMDLFADRYVSQESRASGPWKEDATDGSATVRVSIDYDEQWRGDDGARRLLDAVKGAVDEPIACLTEYHLELLRRDPRAFLASTNRETIDLIGFETDRVGPLPRVTALRLARMPKAVAEYAYLAVVPNLVQIERQLAALAVLEAGRHEALAPLRVLVGACSVDVLAQGEPSQGDAGSLPGEDLDEHQRDCVAKAIASPDFTVIEGPPGSGKTTVIANIAQRALSSGWRMLIASSTHVAVDNIVEKLTKKRTRDDLAPSSTPVRFASRKKAVAPAASPYWVGSKKEHRGVTIAQRVEQVLTAKLPAAQPLFERVDPDQGGLAPLSSAIAAHKPIVCGTPIGILSCDEVSRAEPGSFDLLVVDEVSKMTVPEFLAVAVKAKRWCLVGDPAQMPPFCDNEEVAATLTGILQDDVELVCSVAAVVERVKPEYRPSLDLLVVTDDPFGVSRAIREHAEQVKIDGMPRVQVHNGVPARGIVVCDPEDLPSIAAPWLSSPTGAHKVLVQRGLNLPSDFEGDVVKDGKRSSAASIDVAYYTYHALPWARRRSHKLPLLGLRNGLAKYQPSLAMLEALRVPPQNGSLPEDLLHGERAMAQRFAIHSISVYDWLTGIPTQWFADVALLRKLCEVLTPDLARHVEPFVGRLQRQYRMHPSLSAVPRDLFYFGESLHDGGEDKDDSACKVRLLQVVGAEGDRGEANANEVAAIAREVPRVLATMGADGSIMVITPYRDQERALKDALSAVDQRRVEVCTLDRCQGREADYVFVSLVRDRVRTPFMDLPKRWNVALTRARKGLFLVGNVDNFLREARESRERSRHEGARSSLLALVLDSYDRLRQARRS